MLQATMTAPVKDPAWSRAADTSGRLMVFHYRPVLMVCRGRDAFSDLILFSFVVYKRRTTARRGDHDAHALPSEAVYSELTDVWTSCREK